MPWAGDRRASDLGGMRVPCGWGWLEGIALGLIGEGELHGALQRKPRASARVPRFRLLVIVSDWTRSMALMVA